MRKLLAIVSLLLVFSATPALAVTDGEKDDDGHPMVGMMVAIGGGYAWVCSGTLLNEDTFLTAGHCTYGADSVKVTFDPYVEDTGWANAVKVAGTPLTHPDYDDYGAWWLADVGVVKLDEPQSGPYGKLPYENELDDLYAKAAKKAKKNARFDAVGYGLQKAFPTAASWKDQWEMYRMIPHPKLIQINVKGSTGPLTLLLSNNANTGGTCFGDSGDPNFIKDTFKIAGVTSFGKNGTCAGQGGVFRMDREDARDWVLGEM